MDGLSKAVEGLVKVGVGVFVLILVMVLAYSSFGSSHKSISQASWACSYVDPSGVCDAANVLSGVPANFTTYAGGAANQFGANIGLAIFAVIFAAIILAVISSLREATGEGQSGGFL